MTQLSIMMLVPDKARADVMLCADRIYYHFATDSTVDDGDLPGLKERFEVVAQRIVEAMKPREGERVADADEIHVTAFVDNRAHPTRGITEEALRRVITELRRIDDLFAFLQGFA